ncbi:MAG: uracil-DNA glycosylase [Candidatus Omnitrophota bacterium]
MQDSDMDRIINNIRHVIESEKLGGISELFLANTGNPANPKEKKITLKGLKEEVLVCRHCALARTRTNVVFGEGSPRAELMFIGEAPGSEEDKQARPFVGRAGQLLTKIIESIGFKREDVFIANILKCRPPGNRNPLPGEIETCSPYLIKQIELMKPKVICALGKFAAQTLLDTDTPISKLRGIFRDYHGIKLMPTYHPAYLLRNPAGKKEVWRDMKKIAKELGLKIPSQKK